MSTLIASVLTVATLIWLSLWLSVRAAPYAPVNYLPMRYRRRVKWWLANATHVQLGCVIVFVVAGGLQLSRAVG